MTDTKVAFLNRALHDLQAPARHVKIFSELLRESLSDLPESSREYLDVIERAGSQMQTILESLRSYLRIPERHGNVEPIDLGALLQDCWDRLEKECRSPEQSSSVGRLDLRGSATIRSDPKLMMQVLTEILHNAIRFRRADQTLHVQCAVTESDDRCQITIEDDGVGIEPEYLDRVLEPFECLPGENVTCGVGLGLPMCLNVTALLGGTMTLDSNGVDGTSVKLDFPRQL